MNSALQAALPRPWGASVSQYRWLASAGLVILAVAWPLFVFTGSQTSYLVSLAAACATAAALAATRSSLVLGYLVGLMALVGPGLNGQLGNGHALLGSLRLVDVATAAAAGTVAVSLFASVRSSMFRWRRPGALLTLSVAAVSYAAVRWLMEGHRVDSFLRTDLRLIALAALSWFVATHCRTGVTRQLLWCIVTVGLLAAAKVAAIHYSGLFAIGAEDRLQSSSSYSQGQLRTILVGGDTLLILAPSVVVLLITAARRTSMRIVLALSGLLCLWALGLSATRTSVLVALGLVFAVAVALLLIYRPRFSRRTFTAGVVATMVILFVAMLGGAASRLAHLDVPHAGLNFRMEEVESFLRASATTKYAGQGFGGRFLGADAIGKPVLTGWAHELPVWIALKTGIFGLLCAILALVVIVRRARDALRRGDDHIQILTGLAFLLGLVVMSMTMDRVALPEGIPPLILGVFLISRATRSPTVTSA